MLRKTALFVSISQVIGCEDRLRNYLYCVEWGVKLYSNRPPTTDPFPRLWVQLNFAPVPQTESRRLCSCTASSRCRWQCSRHLWSIFSLWSTLAGAWSFLWQMVISIGGFVAARCTSNFAVTTLCLKKQDTKLLPITSPNVNRFSKFFHW